MCIFYSHELNEIIQQRQTKCLTHRLVEHHRVRVLDQLPDRLVVLVHNNNDLLWLGHSADHQHAEVREHVGVQFAARRLLDAVEALQRVHNGVGRLLERRFTEQFQAKPVPVVEANL
jgi:hypothetical protein